MSEALGDACFRTSDPPDRPTIVVATRQPRRGRGRPKVEIDSHLLSYALDMRGPVGLGPVFGCCSRTVRRRALEYGLVLPGEPVYSDVYEDDGTITRTWTSTTSPISVMTDDDLDREIAIILGNFPHFGRRMIHGKLLSLGHRVPIPRITESYLRVHGSPGTFGDRRIFRRVYWVPGVNSLWHHDGQHGESLLGQAATNRL